MPRVLLVCSGLDHARRGYESFARECFEQLRGEAGLRIELVKGSGPPAPGERAIPVLRRDRGTARALGRRLGARPFRIEALSFAFSLQPLVARRRPDVVYVSEWDTARGLAALRSVTRMRFKILLSNGGFAERGFEHLDHVQELTPAAREHVVALGADPERHTVLPLGFAIAPELSSPTAAERTVLREKWGLPADRPIVITVAALNRSHKRLDYLIDELARVPPPRPFALFVGEPDAETPGLRSEAAGRLGEENHRFLTVSSVEVAELLRASDRFVLTSLAEMQGRAVVEAMSQGLECLVHDTPVMRFAVGPHGVLADFGQPGVLTRLLSRESPRAPEADAAKRRHRYVYDQFSWDVLRPRYVRLLAELASGTRPNRIVSSSAAEKLSR